jgi:5-methylthioadenosine/S-adenosylhomocysteine deaminase
MVAGEIAIEGGRLKRIDEAAILREIESEFRELSGRYAQAESAMAPVLASVEAIYRRSLAIAVAPDTYPARLA